MCAYDTITIFIAVVAFISEVLPLVKQVKCNGILHLIMRLMTNGRCDEESNGTTDIELP